MFSYWFASYILTGRRLCSKMVLCGFGEYHAPRLSGLGVEEMLVNMPSSALLPVVCLSVFIAPGLAAMPPTSSEVAKLTAGDGASGDFLGYAVSVDGDTALVGAWGDDENGGNSGSAYVYTRTDGVWTLQQKLLPADGAASDSFGLAVSLSGDTAVVTSFLDDDNGSNSGSAYVFVRNGEAWTQQQKLIASDGAAQDFYGISVAVDADTIVIGGWGDADQGFGTGSAYVYVRDNGVWTEQQKLTAADGATEDFFGIMVAVDGDTVLIAADGGGVTDAPGKVYVYTRSGGIWSEQQQLMPSDGGVNDEFGLTLALDGDTAVVGAHWHDALGEDSGAVYVYTRDMGVWVEQQKLTASDGSAVDEFGESVAVEDDTLVVGAWLDDDRGENSGSVYVFKLIDGVWTEERKLLASDGRSEDHFGYFRSGSSLSGSTVLVGAPQDTTPGARGAAYIFDLDSEPSVSSLVIDIRPWGTQNRVELKKWAQYLPVAALTTSTAQGDATDFDALQLNPWTVRFGPGRTRWSQGGAWPRWTYVRDVDADGDSDLLMYFQVGWAGINCGDAEAPLRGMTWDGSTVSATDHISVVDCDRP